MAVRTKRKPVLATADPRLHTHQLKGAMHLAVATSTSKLQLLNKANRFLWEKILRSLKNKAEPMLK